MDDSSRRRLSPLVIKMSNFLQYSAAGCIVPYLSVYFLHYTDGSSSHVGIINLLASIFGIVLSLSLSSIGDRYRAHRAVYLVSLLLIFLSVVTLFEPVITEPAGGRHMECIQANETDSSPANNGTHSSATNHAGHLREHTSGAALERGGSAKMQHLPASELIELPGESDELAGGDDVICAPDRPEPRSGADEASSGFLGVSSSTIRFYLVSVCVALAEMAATTNINLSDSFSTDIARRCNSSYGSIRLWGAVGLIFSSTILVVVNKMHIFLKLPFLTQSLCLFTLFHGSNILLVACWPDGRPFDLANEDTNDEAQHQSQLDSEAVGKLHPMMLAAGTDPTWPRLQPEPRTKFTFKHRIWNNLSLSNWFTLRSCKQDLQMQQIFSSEASSAADSGWPARYNDPYRRHTLAPIQLKQARWTFAFDLQPDDLGRNVRRCSLAPLGNSHLIRQFELDVCRSNSLGELPLLGSISHFAPQDDWSPPTGDDAQHQDIRPPADRWSRLREASSRKASLASINVSANGAVVLPKSHAAKRHFNYVTVIEPKSSGFISCSPLSADTPSPLGLANPRKVSPLCNSNNHQQLCHATGANGSNKGPTHNQPIVASQLVTATFSNDDDESNYDNTSSAGPETGEPRQQPKAMSLRLHLKIIQLIAKRDKNMIRFMLLFVVVGFTAAMNWIYLFPYLKSLDESKFKTLAAYVTISSYSGEIIFYKISPQITRLMSHSESLSFVLLIFALRYSLYLVFLMWPQLWPLETIVAIEILQSFSIGLFNCVFVDIAMGLASKARLCVPELIQLGYLSEQSPQLIEQVNNGVKLTLLSVSSCCLDGTGVALGSLVGGWLIDEHGYCTLWLTSISLALACSVLNFCLDLAGFGQTHEEPQVCADQPPDQLKEAPT